MPAIVVHGSWLIAVIVSGDCQYRNVDLVILGRTEAHPVPIFVLSGVLEPRMEVL